MAYDENRDFDIPPVFLTIIANRLFVQKERNMAWDEEDTREYMVVVNHEEQYSIWYVDRELPLGWKEAGFSGTKQECLDYIEEVWTDMRPLSLRKKMEEMEKERGKE